jgi:alkylation response protein AidB-like acyl-CoA dehydrogenase
LYVDERFWEINMQEELLRTELLAEVGSIAPMLTEHAASSERLGRLDAPSVEAVRNTRLLRMYCPRELGGLEIDPVTWILVLEALARIDGSAGWTIGILGSSLFAAGYLPAATVRQIFVKGIPPMAVSLLPKGRAEPVAGGYRVNGRWPFASGIHHADWVLAGVFLAGEPGLPGARLVMFPQNQVVIHDNWQVSGLKATGSCDFSVEDVFVPEEMTCPLMDVFRGNAVTGGPAIRLGMPALVAPFHIGIPLGIARRALDEITTQAIEKGRGVPPSPLHTQPHFQFALGRAEIELAAARAFALQFMSELYAEAQTGGASPPPRQAEARAAATYVTEVAQRVTNVAFQAAGGGALFDANPLQRCLRDVLAAGQHFVVSQTAYQALGQFKLNQPDANPML